MGGFLPPAERRSSALVGLYAALALILLITGDRLPQSTLRGIGAWIFAPFDRVVLAVDRASAAWRENQRLHQRVAELELETVRLRDEAVENQRLRLQLGLPPRRGVTLKPVEVLALSGELVPSSATLGFAGVQVPAAQVLSVACDVVLVGVRPAAGQAVTVRTKGGTSNGVT